MKNTWNISKKTHSLTTLALLMSLAIILGFFTIQIGDFLKIGFSFIPQQLASFLFGPAAGAAFGGIADILKYLIKPTGAFFPGFTISGILSGLIYGLIMYNKPPKITRIFLANAIVTIFVNMILNTYWLTILYGSSFLAILPARIFKELIMLAINSMLIYIILNSLNKIKIIKTSRFKKISN